MEVFSVRKCHIIQTRFIFNRPKTCYQLKCVLMKREQQYLLIHQENNVSTQCFRGKAIISGKR